MPRKAPDNVQEMRVTFGTYERQFVKEIKTDIETGAKVAVVSAVAVPVAAVAGFGLLAFGIYKSGEQLAKGLSNFSFGWPSVPDTGDIFDWVFPPIDPDLSTTEPKEDLGRGGLLSATLFFWTGGVFGEDPKVTRARRDAAKQGGGGGDF